MSQNDILLRRIAKLIAMSYAMDEKEVYDRILHTNSIDKTLDEIQEKRDITFKQA